MCTAQSNPNIEMIGVSNPIITDTPVLLHPPLLENSVKTAFALLRGARTQSGIIMAKRPKTWRTKTRPSTKGSFLARKVLKRIEKVEMAITSMVPCQRWKL
jgi:hypothetical protein